jgi:hypothetical protein
MNLQPSSVHSLPSAQSLALEHLSSVPEHIGMVTRTTTQTNSVKWRTATLPAYFFALLSQQRNTSSLLVGKPQTRLITSPVMAARTAEALSVGYTDILSTQEERMSVYPTDKKRGDPARTPMVRFAVSQNVNKNNTSLMIMHEYTRRHVHVTSPNLT